MQGIIGNSGIGSLQNLSKTSQSKYGILGDLVRDGIINKDKPHHLLGCGLPQEFSFYKHNDYNFIYSLDTSNPVVHGIKGIQYGAEGLWSKESQKLHELIDFPLDNLDINLILHNITKFRKLTNG